MLEWAMVGLEVLFCVGLPLWIVWISAVALQIRREVRKMAAIDDLNTNIATLNTNVAALTAALGTFQAGSVPSAAVEAAAGQVGAAATAVASLTASLAPAA